MKADNYTNDAKKRELWIYDGAQKKNVLRIKNHFRALSEAERHEPYSGKQMRNK